MRKNGTLTFIIGDHLGSSSLVTDATGTVINQTQYKAWGETRYSSGTEQTKYTYTGQYSYVSDFGLHFYNARWYDSSLSRFAQADTIIPRGVQGHDRYAYTNNNPINYTDPSGHVPVDCYGTNYCQGTTAIQKLSQYGVNLHGFQEEKDISAAYYAVSAVAKKIAQETNSNNPISAFRSAYDITNENQMHFYMSSSFEYNGETYTAGGVTRGPHWIDFANLADATYDSNGNTLRSPIEAWIEARNNIVHELGHAFAQQWYAPGANPAEGPYEHDQLNGLLGTEGFQISSQFAPKTWNQHPSNTSGNEVFADMFLGWTFNQWDLTVQMGETRQEFMNTNMPGWLASHP